MIPLSPRSGLVAVAGTALWAVLSARAPAQASDVDLTLRAPPAPEPTGLSMRAQEKPQGSRDETSKPAPASATIAPRDRAGLLELLTLPEPISRVADKVTFRFSLGYGLDGADPSGEPLATGAMLQDGTSGTAGTYQSLRIYGFGDLVAGSRDLLMPGLLTYAAASFRIEQDSTALATGVPSVYDASTERQPVLVRHAFGEIRDRFRNRWLRPLFLRLGRQFRYGAAIAHFDGITVGYETPAVSITTFSGERVSLFGLVPSGRSRDAPGAISGGSFHANLYRLKRTPLALGGSFLLYDDLSHLRLLLSLRIRRDIRLRGSVRARGSELARERAVLRIRTSRVTSFQIALDNRHVGDWSYDLVVASPDHNDNDARRFLTLGIPMPRLRISGHAGTVLMDNLDLLVRGAANLDTRDQTLREPSPFAPSYLEGGVAAEMRFRRSVRLGASLLVRGYRREPNTWEARPDLPDQLPSNTAAFGERSFAYGDISLRYVFGDRAVVARADLYGRRYGRPSPLRPDITSDNRMGGRFSVVVRSGRYLRVRGEYDSAFSPTYVAPEILGGKALRVSVEGSF